MIIEQAEEGHEINTVGWQHLIAWLDYYAKEDPSVYSILTAVDYGISDSLSEFSEKLSP